jgi:lysophospholipid acyltransferase (LPLAT)-like uncharacterized protein
MKQDLESEPEPDSKGAETRRPRAFAGKGLALFGWLSSAILRLLGATWRVEVLGRDPHVATGSAAAPHPLLAALLHESLLVSAWVFRDLGYCVAVSRSRDGSLVAATLRALGFADPARGSSSRGGSAALMELLRQLEAGTTVAMLVDGPRGPAGVAKPGIAALARHSATPIQPVALAARPALRLRSWDRSLVPLPFARVVCAYGEPLAPLAEDADKAREEALAGNVTARLAHLQRRAEDHLDRRDRPRR